MKKRRKQANRKPVQKLEIPVKYQASDAHQELASYIGFNQNGCYPDDTVYTIQEILLAEIKRLRQERAKLVHLVENHLTALQKEQETMLLA
jgi:hypothetical protein